MQSAILKLPLPEKRSVSTILAQLLLKHNRDLNIWSQCVCGPQRNMGQKMSRSGIGKNLPARTNNRYFKIDKQGSMNGRYLSPNASGLARGEGDRIIRRIETVIVSSIGHVIASRRH
jgi:hypothetical protein